MFTCCERYSTICCPQTSRNRRQWNSNTTVRCQHHPYTNKTIQQIMLTSTQCYRNCNVIYIYVLHINHFRDIVKYCHLVFRSVKSPSERLSHLNNLFLESAAPKLILHLIFFLHGVVSCRSIHMFKKKIHISNSANCDSLWIFILSRGSSISCTFFKREEKESKGELGQSRALYWYFCVYILIWCTLHLIIIPYDNI